MLHSHSKDCLIIDNFPLVREAIARIVSSLDTVNLIHQISDTQVALDLVKAGSIDLIVLDVNLAEADGFEFMRRAFAAGYKGRSIFISSYGYPIYSETAYKLGANGYLSKSEEPALIRDAISGVIRGYNLFKTDYKVSNRKIVLSQRETVVFNYLKKGYTNKQISEFLSLSAKTISTYKSRILDKYEAKSIVELVNSHDVVQTDIRLAS
ncbi:DNA-binding response regulator [Vibrio sp. 10N.286.49.C2]|uniref:response regulator transcription factor n=1 Tax=unclassified Vibrio TaxID=2614977 RepID=UPI000C81965F|nr:MULTISPECIES: response regulator transcription factor [unclassified Vibrio]PMH43304.1 DNA-binding response regulator [Vibrio sp. 10N.286.49.C2]PMH56956.1 DNA-binding response regulator [Vibrio sp. 10N.286.49.B1]PMH81503.1 DNA-binding response regulator [Vibrio sp. 10N.286.48.B7]